jgi:hypothetical protein
MTKQIKVVNGLGPKVGVGNPPKHSQFRKGTSGNPQGRPKGSRNLRTVLLEAADHPVTAEIGGKQRNLSALEATAFRLAEKAANGDAKSIAAFLDWVDEIQTQAAAAKPSEFPLGEQDVEVLRAAYERVKRPRRIGAGSSYRSVVSRAWLSFELL